MTKKSKIINPIDKDNITEEPGTLSYGHHRGSFPVIPTKQGAIKNKALAAMEHQTDIQLQQIKDQMFWPSGWCKSFKHDLLTKWPLRIWKPAKLPLETYIVAFTGKPDPDDVIKGQWPVKNSQIYKKLYKQLKTPQWVLDNLL